MEILILLATGQKKELNTLFKSHHQILISGHEFWTT